MRQLMTPRILLAALFALIGGRALLATAFPVPRTFDLLNTVIVMVSLWTIYRNVQTLQRRDWALAIGAGLLVGGTMPLTTLFSPYPFFDLIDGTAAQGLLRGLFTAIALLGGLAVTRQGGPVPCRLAANDWHQTSQSIWLGLAIGLPFAAVNIVGLQLTQHQPIQWQSPIAAIIDALQPAIVEETLYRFALWGWLWQRLSAQPPAQAVWLAGLLATLAHAYAHVDDLWLSAPLIGFVMGGALALVWGVPALLLARRYGLEAAIAFHWMQDAVRFIAGF
ncbi:CPBP family intramembrane glutamic endopeptidase [Chloroflexus sp.]|uniref:CPBP family intramembrane glutamic endopeptidase n=1 Tax=Chloroflexus sp. TaxID=1904827 RepID=UPI002ACECCE6|nr:CPBP family intramembrane glutamic endopeptidase [Chloroflexus sp.]